MLVRRKQLNCTLISLSQHFIFVIAAFLAWLVLVKNEIRREKLLAYEAVHARKEQDLEVRAGIIIVAVYARKE